MAWRKWGDAVSCFSYSTVSSTPQFLQKLSSSGHTNIPFPQAPSHSTCHGIVIVILTQNQWNKEFYQVQSILPLLTAGNTYLQINTCLSVAGPESCWTQRFPVLRSLSINLMSCDWNCQLFLQQCRDEQAFTEGMMGNCWHTNHSNTAVLIILIYERSRNNCLLQFWRLL